MIKKLQIFFIVVLSFGTQLINAQTDCSSPISFGTSANVPISQTGLTSCGFVNDYTSADACNSTFLDGEDYVIRFGLAAAADEGCYTISAANTSANTGVFVFNGCPNNAATSCVGFNEAAAGNPSVNVTLSFGVSYYIMISTTAAQGCTSFDFSLIECPPEPGDDCAAPYPISTYPYSETGLTTCGAGDDYSSADACGSDYLNGEDFTIEFTATSTECHEITLSNTGSSTGLFVFDGCPDVAGTNCLSAAESPTGNPSLEVDFTAGNVYYITVSTSPAPDCTDFDIEIDACPPPAPGDDCSIPFIINSVPYSNTGLTTCGADDDYDNTDACSSNYMTGEDFVIEFTAPSTDCFEFELTGTETFTGIFVLDGCPDAAGSSCLGSSTETGGNPSLQINLTSGVTYTVVISTLSPPDCTDFQLAIDVCPPTPPGTDCVFPFYISGGIAYNESGATTCGFGDDFDSTDACSSSFMNGEDFVYQFTPSLDTCYAINISNTDGTADVGTFIVDGCPDDATTNCIASDTQSNGGTYIEADLTAGQPYYIVISTSPTPDCTNFDIDIGICPPPPEPANDCDIALVLCNSANLNFNSFGIGNDDFADADNGDGCLSDFTPENQSSWMVVEIDNGTPAGSTLGFSIDPNVPSDYDFAVWGPDVACDNLGDPIRCSFAAGTGSTGLNSTSVDLSEGAGGDRWVAELVVNPGETYIIMVDNWAENNEGYQLTWTGDAALSCNDNCPAEGGTSSSIAQPSNVSLNFPFPGSDPEQYILCIGDRFEFESNNDFLLPTPETGEVADIAWAIFSGAPQPEPTILDSEFSGIVIPDTNIDDINNLSENSTLPNGLAITNNTIYLVPVTLDDGEGGGNPNGTITIDANGDDCYDFGTPVAVTYLNEITHTATNECGGPAITILGGMPEFFPATYTLSNLIPTSANFTTATPAHNEVFTILGIAPGDGYAFDVTDANGCTHSINGSFEYDGAYPDLATINPIFYCGDDFDLANVNVNDFNNAGGAITFHNESAGMAGTELASTTITTSGTYYAITSVGIEPADCKDTTFVDINLQTLPDLSLATATFSGCSPYDASGIVPVDNNSTGGTLNYYHDNGSNQPGTEILDLTNVSLSNGDNQIFVISSVGVSPNVCTDTLFFTINSDNCCSIPDFISN